ncbi:MAG: STAS-like domain-containing protein [bacterium]
MNLDQTLALNVLPMTHQSVVPSSNGSSSYPRNQMLEEVDMIKIATDFSAYPAGRDDNDGPFNGSRFRSDILVPRLKSAIASGRKLVVSLDGVRSFGSSFLEESFGGLVRLGFSKNELTEHLQITATAVGSSRYVEAILRYIARATV